MSRETRATPQRVCLLLLLLALFALALLRLGAQSLWYDEGVTAMVARKAVRDLVAWTAADIQPPLYYLVVRAGGALWGWSEWALRFPSALATLVATALMARLAGTWRQRTPGREGRDEWTPVIAAGLLGLHPFVHYHAQEARMYALVLALTLAAAVCLAPALSGTFSRRSAVLLGVLGALALYTHYFAAFALVALLLGFLLSASAARRTSADSLRNVYAAFALLAVLYAPWAVVMLRRLGDDTSYWQGSLKLGEALAEIAARFVGGETLPERTALLLAPVVLVLTAAGVIRAWSLEPAQRPALKLGLVWLLVPVAGVLALASFVPKFNVRYLFAALPGLVLLWAVPAGILLRVPRSARRRALLLLPLAALLGIFAWSTANWQMQGRYAKAQWRELTEFLRPRLQSDERIVLVSGHAWPVWDYYAPDLPVIRLPAIDVLDVNRVLDFADTGPTLRAELIDAGGAWLVGWQDEVTDPNQVVPVQLELGGREKGSSALFNQLTLRRWSRIRTERIAVAPPISVPVGAAFADAVTLVGYHALDNGDLLLFWQAGQALAGRDLHVALAVTDRDGNPVASPQGRRLGGYTWPTTRWPQEQIVMGRFPAAEWLGPAPAPGAYTLTLRVYDGNDPAATPLPVADADFLRLEHVVAVIE